MCGIVLGPVYTFEEFLTDNKETQEYDSELYIK